MSTEMIRQTTFTFGEVDEVTWKRTDVNEYLTAAQSLLNCEVGTTGLCKKRKGMTELLNVTGQAQFNSKMYEFIDKFGNEYLIILSGGMAYIYLTPTTENQVVTYTGALVVTAYGTNVVVNSESLSLIQSFAIPYMTGDLDNIDYTQDNDSIIFSNPSYLPLRIYVSQYNGGNPPTFAWQYLNIYPFPAFDFNQINYNATAVTLSVSGNTLTITFAGLPAGATYTNAWIGGQIIGGGTSVNSPLGYAIIQTVSQTGTSVTFTATIQIAFETTGYAQSGSQYSIRQPAWSAALGYPAKVLYFQNRLWFANTASLSNTIFGSQINEPINFDVGVGLDTDAIIYTVGQTNAGAILWMNGGKQLEIYCQNDEFACPQNQALGLTPTTFAIRQQSSYGSSSLLKPVTYINDSYYSTKSGKALINYHFNGIGLTYASTNISAASSHLVKQPINRALLRGTDTSQDNFIYFLNPGDDTLTAFQFVNEYKLAALTPVQFQDNVELVDIVTIGNTVYLLKFYSLTQQYIVEIFDDSTRMDCTGVYAMESSGVVNGLSQFNGYTVQVTYLNQDFGQYLVANGTITVNNPQMIADNVLIGLLYDVTITPMFPFAGATHSAFKKQVTRIYVDYNDSLDFMINGNLVPYQNFAEIQAGLPLTPKSLTAIVSPFSGWNRFSNNGVPIISITQSSPFDLKIIGIGYQVASAVI